MMQGEIFRGLIQQCHGDLRQDAAMITSNRGRQQPQQPIQKLWEIMGGNWTKILGGYRIIRIQQALQALRLPFWFPITVPLGVITADGTYLVNPDKSQLERKEFLSSADVMLGRHWLCFNGTSLLLDMKFEEF